MTRFDPRQVGWRLGTGREPRGGDLWVPWDRTAGVIGPQGSGKTLDLLTPALLAAPGPALVTLTKVSDLLLSITDRGRGDRPVLVLDPFGLAPRLPELVWDPIAGCIDPMLAERRAKAFTAGTVKGAVANGSAADARFYAAESAKVIQAFFHAAALTGRLMKDMLRWVANPSAATEPEEILRNHPHAARNWDGLLRGALHGDDRTAVQRTELVHADHYRRILRSWCAFAVGDLVQLQHPVLLGFVVRVGAGLPGLDGLERRRPARAGPAAAPRERCRRPPP